MNNLFKFAFLFFFIKSGYATYHKNTSENSTDYPPLCDNPPSTNIEPEKCCKFPTFFDEKLSQKCENEFGVADNSSVGDMISDSCVIECMFNKSGLNKDSKLIREDIIKLFTNNTKNESNTWGQLIPKAIDQCFIEMNEEDIGEIVAHIKAEVGKELKSMANKICHPVSSIMLDCIYRELYKVCPKERFSSNMADCGILQNYTKTCDDW